MELVLLFLLLATVVILNWIVFSKLYLSSTTADEQQSRMDASKKMTLAFSIISTMALVLTLVLFYVARPANKTLYMLLIMSALFNFINTGVSWALYSYLYYNNFDDAKQISSAVAVTSSLAIFFVIMYCCIKMKQTRKIGGMGGSVTFEDIIPGGASAEESAIF